MGLLTKFKKIKERFVALILPQKKYAQYLGVKIGKNCLISTRNWSTEPYLITIGNNVQVTKDVYFHTHGGAHVARKDYPCFDVFGKKFPKIHFGLCYHDKYDTLKELNLKELQ